MGGGFLFETSKHNYLFSQVNIRNLQYIDLKSKSHKNYSQVNKAGYYIHKYLHISKAKPDAILHTHSINAIAISSLSEGFNEKLSQSSMRFYKRVKYYSYKGMVIDAMEADKLKNIVENNTKLIILKNHGIIILGKSIQELFHLNYHFEKCCEVQLKLNSKKINKITNKIAQLTCSQHESFGKVGYMSWNASLKELKKKQ